MNDIELDLVNNVAQKLEIYMQENSLTIFSLAKAMNIDKQLFYRVINKRNVPTIPTLITMASNMNCSIQELISKQLFIEVDIYNDIYMLEKQTTRRAYISYEEYTTINGNKIVGIENVESIDVYFLTEKFSSDGIYIVKKGLELSKLEILSVGSKFMIADVKGEEKKINSTDFDPIAKLLTVAPIVTASFIR